MILIYFSEVVTWQEALESLYLLVTIQTSFTPFTTYLPGWVIQ